MTMADLFDFLGDTAAPINSLACASVSELESRLRGILAEKVTDTKAEHVSFTFELSTAAKFTLSVSESDNDSLETLGNLDPSLGGVRSMGPVQNVNGQMVRVINASDTVMNQPQNDGVLQRAVAKHIIAAISGCDASTWTVREVSRGPHGWTLTYVCKDSMQAWKRANPDAPRALIGEYSQKELDPVIASQPGFDCRGTVTIAFSRSSRSINVHYEHTRMHMTVAQLQEHYAPPPPPRPVPVVETPKKPAKSSKKRAAPGDGEGASTRKKARTKKRSEGQAVPEAPMVPGDLSVPGGGTASADVSMPDVANSSGYPEALMGGEPASGQTGDQPAPKPKRKRASRPKKPKAQPTQNGEGQASAGQAAANGEIQGNSIVNVDPNEAARRRERALNLLQGANIDPNTLSADQFNIFANQSPDLQKESLAMLVEHGAEKLRIVHPSREEPTPAAANQSTPAPEGSGKKSRRKRSGVGASNAGTSTPKQKLTRGPCNECKKRKITCNRAKPTCNMCAEASIECAYAVAVPRGKKKSDAVVDDDQQEAEQLQAERELSTLDSPGFDTAPTPVAEMQLNADESMNLDSSITQDYFQRAHTLALPDLSQQAIQVASNLGFPETQDHRVGDTLSNPAYALANVTPQPEPVSYPAPAVQPAPGSPRTTKKASQHRSSGSGSQRSLPSAPVAAVAPTPEQHAPLALPQAAATANSNWSSVVSRTDTASPVPAAIQASNVQTAQGSSGTGSYDSHTHAQGATVADQPSPTVQGTPSYNQGRNSPYQGHAQNPRAKSRQGHRAQTHTPVPDQSASRVARSSTPQQTQTHTQTNTHAQASTSQRPARSTGHGQQPPQTTTQGSSSSTYNTSPDTSGPSSFGYGNYSNSSDDQGSSRIPYEPYQEQQSAANVASTYGSYDFNRTGSKAVSMTTQATEPASSGYATTTTAAAAADAPASAQWSSTQNRNTRFYNSGSSTPATSTYSYPSTTQTASQTQFNLRSSTPAQIQSYPQQSPQQPAQHQQPVQQQQQQQPQQQQSSSYGSYNQAQNHGQKDWNYGFNSGTSFTAANTNPPNYRSTRSNQAGYGTTSYHQQQQQQHHSGLSLPNHGGHAYGGNEDEALMDILRGSVPNRG